MKPVALLIALCICFHGFAQLTPYERAGKNYTATYEECIRYYEELDKRYRTIQMETCGETDAGFPLQVVFFSQDAQFNPEQWKQQGKSIVLINNGIHPGEPDGIDASMMLLRDLAEGANNLPAQNLVLAVIPVYNIGGCLRRSIYNRVDQEGPESFGERGNARNLDLNRDFIKCDSREALSFTRLFQELDPLIFMDNHVSDGADYAHIITLATTQYDKLGGVQGSYLREVMDPHLYKAMANRNYPMIPYVNVWSKDARQGWSQFFDGPKYSTGYAALFQVMGFTLETHMLKPYEQRVSATYALMEEILRFTNDHQDTLEYLKQKARIDIQQQSHFAISWLVDSQRSTRYPYQGYTYIKKKSDVSGLMVPMYDRTQPYATEVPVYNYYKAAKELEIPEAYVIAQAWHQVIDRLQANGVDMIQIESDSIWELEVCRIIHTENGSHPYEGHYPHSKTRVQYETQKVQVFAGDWYIPAHQKARRYLIEVLEPETPDGFFSWNFFDAILGQKEGYSDYAYESYAARYLQEHPDVRAALDEECKKDSSLANSASAQLDFVYKHSPYAERRYRISPVYRCRRPLAEGHKKIKYQTSSSSRHDE